MRIIYDDKVIIEVEPGEEHQAAELIRALASTPRPGPHPRGRGKRALDDEGIERLKHLRAGGLGTDALAKELGVGRTTVRNYLAQLGLLESQQHPEDHHMGTRVNVPPDEDEPLDSDSRPIRPE